MNTADFTPPFAQNLTQFPQGMDFMKQLWQSAAGVATPMQPASTNPSSNPSVTPAFSQAMGQYFMPTMDVDELDRRLSDLRTVLQFMEMNTHMLRQSLNALEVQRNTLAALKAMAAAPADATNAAQASTANPTAPWLAAWESIMGAVQNHTQPVQAPPETAPKAKPNTTQKPAPAPRTRAASKK